jgi:hypothetical protein
VSYNIVTKKDFEAWLKSKDPSDIVGISVNGQSCPIATFLKEYCGVTGVDVSGFDYLYYDSMGHYREAKGNDWMELFIGHVDDLFMEKINFRQIPNKEVTAGAALACLRKSTAKRKKKTRGIW